MRCEEFEENLSEYIDGQLGLDQAARVELHALQCPACRDTLRGVEQVCRELKRLAQVGPTARFRLGGWGELQDKWDRKQQRWWSSITLGLAVAVALSILLWPDQYSAPPEYSSWEGQRYPEAEWMPTATRNLDSARSEKFFERTYPAPPYAKVRLTAF